MDAPNSPPTINEAPSASPLRVSDRSHAKRNHKRLGTVRAVRQLSPTRPAQAGNVSRAAKVHGTAARREPNEKAQCWCITVQLDKPMSTEKKLVYSKFHSACQVNPCTYAVFQLEIAPETGRRHVQAYVEMEKAVTLAFLKKHFGNSIHAEIRRGTQQQAIDYCTKEESRERGCEPEIFGTPMKTNAKGKTAGARNDWKKCHALVDEGQSTLDVLHELPHLTPNIKAIEHYRFLVNLHKTRSAKTKLIVLYGDPGTGKTSTAISMCGEDDYYLVPADGKDLWWDGYDCDKHKTVIFDEFTGARMPMTLLNQLADRCKLHLQVKGGHTVFLAERIIVTSNFAPKDWWKNMSPESFQALERRIDYCAQFTWRSEFLGSDRLVSVKRLHLEYVGGADRYVGLRNAICCNPHAPQLDECCRPRDDSSELDGEVVVRPLTPVPEKPKEYAKRSKQPPLEPIEDYFSDSGSEDLQAYEQLDLSDGEGDGEASGDDCHESADDGSYDFDVWDAKRRRLGQSSDEELDQLDSWIPPDDRETIAKMRRLFS